MRVLVGQGSCGIAAGAKTVYNAIAALRTEEDSFELVNTGCNGMCYLEPIVDIYDGDELVQRLVMVQEKDAQNIVASLRTQDFARVAHLGITAGDQSFLDNQTRIVMRNCGVVDPTNIGDYIRRGGYDALKKALTTMTPEEVIEEIKLSGLSGRGGAGFPTWFKWNACRTAPGERHYLICNADEGDPGAFMDRAVLESDPHTVLEGMLIAAYAIGAEKAFIYVRVEYVLANRHLREAVSQLREAGMLGQNILGTDFSCEIVLKVGAGAFVCGEETALLESLEGRRGMPRLKPPFPANSGYKKYPSNINNVETFANVAWIISNGAAAFAALGTEDSKGTKVFALTGKVVRGGLVEIPMGKTLQEVVFDIGGGIREGGQIKSIQLGGPSGGCIPKEMLSTVVDYKALSATGAIMGSGGMVVMDEHTCSVDLARFFLDFTMKESCGKCVHCRLGTKYMYDILNRICEGQGEEGDVELLEEICNSVKDGALCGLGQTAPNPVLTTIRYFRDEYDAHIREKRCPAHSCVQLLTYSINGKRCIGCTLCAKKCPTGAIHGVNKRPHIVDNEKCIKCGNCLHVCRFDAVEVD